MGGRSHIYGGNMSTIELRQIIGETRIKGVVRRIAHDMDILLLDGFQIATINHVPGAAIRLLGDAALTPSQEEAVMTAVADKRGGVRPSKIIATTRIPGEFLDDEETDLEDDDE
jgi:hypothetical protein